jgi:hypothetical protein
MEVIKDKGFDEILLLREGTIKEYEIALDFLEKSIKLEKKELINDFDSCYFVFEYKKVGLILYYSNFTGISIYCENTNTATSFENEVLYEIARLYTTQK